MAAPDPVGGAVWRRSAALLLLLAGIACASAPPPAQPLPPRAVTPPPSDPAPAEPPRPAPAEPKPPAVVVIDPGGAGEAAPATLAEAAAQERERRRTAEQPIAVINDKNLAAYAAGVTLTEAAPAAAAASQGGETAEGPLLAGGHDEAWWRARGLEVRKRWRDALDAIPPLEAEVEQLRQRFYATDDPYVRDAQIKPAWDRALADLEDARRRAEEGPREVEAYLDEGRTSGALPGWLREGSDLEPEPAGPEADGAEPREPEVLAEPPSDP